jgi:hypothetical protein
MKIEPLHNYQPRLPLVYHDNIYEIKMIDEDNASFKIIIDMAHFHREVRQYLMDGEDYKIAVMVHWIKYRYSMNKYRVTLNPYYLPDYVYLQDN